MAGSKAETKIKATLYEPTFYKIIQGGQGAGKTYAIMRLLSGYCDSYPGSKVTVVGPTYGHLKDGAISDFKNILRDEGRWDERRWNKSELVYKFEDGSEMQFRSVDKIGGRGPRRDVVYVNEADGISFEVFEHIAGRSRDFAIIDFNPVAEFWAHTELLKKRRERCSFLVLTYLDNQFLPAQELENILSHKPKPGEEPSNWWVVYGLGQVGSLEGNVYEGWEEIPRTAFQTGRLEGAEAGENQAPPRLLRYGLDFGFSNDETALLAVYEFEDGRTGVLELLYQRGLLGSQYPATLERLGVDKNVLIVADSARPEIIAEIKRAGFRIIGADKNPGSVLRGISRVKERTIAYFGPNLKREYYSYHWRRKRTGEIIDEPEDGNDHLMDALRYAIDDIGRGRISFSRS